LRLRPARMSSNQNVFSAPAELKAITINGAVHVESDEDRKKREERRKNRKSRWGGQTAVPAYIPNVKKKSTILLEGEKPMTAEKRALLDKLERDNANKTVTMKTQIDLSSVGDDTAQKIYLVNCQIQEISALLATPDLGIPKDPRDRSPSPEPIYNSNGKRLNTRLDRTRNKLISQRNICVSRLKELDPTYQPPSAFKYRNAELEDKVMIPAEEHPEINFVGLILGPRGNSLEAIKKRHGTMVAIRGKGSLKDGMSGITKDGKIIDHLDEPMHAYITGPTAEAVKGTADEIRELIEMQVFRPDCEKAVAIRAKHMHELAILNGTLRDIDNKCLNCGAQGHKTWECKENSIFTASVICNACGGIGHVTADCKQRRPGAVFNFVPSKDRETIDKEYDAFLDDLVGDGLVKPKPKKPKTEEKKVDAPYVPPMSLQGNFGKARQTPLMLTDGSSAPGAASAKARALSSGKIIKQTAGGHMEVVGESIFGGKMTRMTSGYKNAKQIEREQEEKKKEYENRTVPIEWQVEKFQKKVNKEYDEYMTQLEEKVRLEKERKAMKAAGKSETETGRPALPPPPPPPGSSKFADDDDAPLPDVVGNPLAYLKK